MESVPFQGQRSRYAMSRSPYVSEPLATSSKGKKKVGGTALLPDLVSCDGEVQFKPVKAPIWLVQR